MTENAKKARVLEGTLESVEPEVKPEVLEAPSVHDLDGLEAEGQGQGQIQIGMKDGRLEIEDLVVNPTWREILTDLVVSEQLDPWNLDIVEITSKYIERVKKLKDLELHIPANVILAAAIFLRLKSESLKLVEEVVENDVYVEDSPLADAPMLHLRMRVPPQRTITLTDLVNALEEVMSLEKVREQRKKERVQVLELKLPNYDIENEMSSMLAMARKLADEKGWLTFSNLIKNRQKTNIRKETASESIVFSFLPLLYLEHNNKLFLLQEKLFGEILININPEDSAPTEVAE